MQLTRRGRAVVVLVAATVSIGLGVTAQYWNPYTRHLDKQYEDGSYRNGTCEPGALCDDSREDGLIRPE